MPYKQAKAMGIGQGAPRFSVMQPSLAHRYVPGLVFFAIAAGLAWIPDFHPAIFFLLFISATAAAAWFGGFESGVVCVLLATILGSHQYHWARLNPSLRPDAVEYAVFISFLTGAMLLAAMISRFRYEHGQLKSAEETLRLALRASQAWAWELDLETNTVTRSKDAADFFGLEPGELGNDAFGFTKYVHPEDQEKVDVILRAAQGDRAEHEVELRIIRPDGQMRWLSLRGRAIHGATGAPVKVIGTSMDVTLRKRAEEALVAGNKLEAAGGMAATIAHEINNPLEGINGMLYLISMEKGLPEIVYERLQMAQGEVNRITHIVRQTLGLYRDPQQPVRVKVSAVLEEAKSMLQRKAQKAGVGLRVECECDEELEVFASELRQVLVNLLENAIFATPESGMIRVRVRACKEWSSLQWHLRREGVRIAVADTGAGIATEVRARIFEPFYTTKGERGTGLGLWVIRNILAQWGGTIRVRSSRRKEASGTCFWLFIPKYREVLSSRRVA